MKFLSAEWVDAQGESSVDAIEGGFTGRVQHTVTGGPGGSAVYVVTWTDGRPTASAAGGEGDAEVALTIPYTDAVAVTRGEADLNALFMQGQMKVAGATGPLLDLLAASQREALVAEVAALAAVTDFG